MSFLKSLRDFFSLIDEEELIDDAEERIDDEKEQITNGAFYIFLAIYSLISSFYFIIDDCKNLLDILNNDDYLYFIIAMIAPLFFYITSFYFFICYGELTSTNSDEVNMFDGIIPAILAFIFGFFTCIIGTLYYLGYRSFYMLLIFLFGYLFIRSLKIAVTNFIEYGSEIS